MFLLGFEYFLADILYELCFGEPLTHLKLYLSSNKIDNC